MMIHWKQFGTKWLISVLLNSGALSPYPSMLSWRQPGPGDEQRDKNALIHCDDCKCEFWFKNTTQPIHSTTIHLVLHNISNRLYHLALLGFNRFGYNVSRDLVARTSVAGWRKSLSQVILCVKQDQWIIDTLIISGQYSYAGGGGGASRADSPTAICGMYKQPLIRSHF